MDTRRILMVAAASACVVGWSTSAHADAKARFAEACAECHEVGDFAGEDATGLADTLRKISAGQVKHKSKISLSDAEITEIAAYMSKGGR
jgi:mono/diheme cytochrome c family protein